MIIYSSNDIVESQAVLNFLQNKDIDCKLEVMDITFGNPSYNIFLLDPHIDPSEIKKEIQNFLDENSSS